MLTTRQMKLITGVPKAENHIHIEGSIPWELALELAKKNKVTLPCDDIDSLRAWVMKTMAEGGLEGFMTCDRTINSVCIHEEDYMEVVLGLAKNAMKQNIIYQELHLDYPLNGQRGIPMEVVMEGYRAGQTEAKKRYGVEVVFIAALDRTLPPEQCLDFVKKLERYLDMVDALGMDCEERGHPCRNLAGSYRLAKDMGLFLTGHTGEELGPEEVWDALNLCGLQRIEHGIHAMRDPELVQHLASNKILCAMCPTANIFTSEAKDYESHPIRPMMEAGVPVSISSDDPPYMVDMVQEYANAIEKMNFTEDELLLAARNAFQYSIKGKAQKYLGLFDKWVEDFKRAEA